MKRYACRTQGRPPRDAACQRSRVGRRAESRRSHRGEQWPARQVALLHRDLLAPKSHAIRKPIAAPAAPSWHNATLGSYLSLLPYCEQRHSVAASAPLSRSDGIEIRSLSSVTLFAANKIVPTLVTSVEARLHDAPFRSGNLSQFQGTAVQDVEHSRQDDALMRDPK